MAFVGMDVEQVKGIGNSLNLQADSIGNVIAQIEALIGQAAGAWQGTDATQFQDWWNSQHKPALLQAQEAIAGLGQSAINNASAQESASGS